MVMIQFKLTVLYKILTLSAIQWNLTGAGKSALPHVKQHCIEICRPLIVVSSELSLKTTS